MGHCHSPGDPPPLSKHHLLFQSCGARHGGGSIYSNFLLLEILNILPVITGPMLVPWPGLSQEQALCALLSSRPPQSLVSGMHERPPPARRAVQTLPPSLSQPPSVLSPAAASALSKGCGHNGDACLLPGARGGLAPTPVLSQHPGRRVGGLTAPVTKHMLLPPRQPNASAGCSAQRRLHALLPALLFPAPSFLSSLFPPVSFSNSSRDRSYSASSNSHVMLSAGP